MKLWKMIHYILNCKTTKTVSQTLLQSNTPGNTKEPKELGQRGEPEIESLSVE